MQRQRRGWGRPALLVAIVRRVYLCRFVGPIRLQIELVPVPVLFHGPRLGVLPLPFAQFRHLPKQLLQLYGSLALEIVRALAQLPCLLLGALHQLLAMNPLSL